MPATEQRRKPESMIERVPLRVVIVVLLVVLAVVLVTTTIDSWRSLAQSQSQSCQTDNSAGAIVSGLTDDVLPTEFFDDQAKREQVFQPHYEVISDEGQVQIYEEVIADPQGKITTSFVGLDHVLKNNRLLPKGWRLDGPLGEFTAPHGDAERDPEYMNKSGATGADRITYR